MRSLILLNLVIIYSLLERDFGKAYRDDLSMVNAMSAKSIVLWVCSGLVHVYRLEVNRLSGR
jgi:hypothetical protein